MESAALVWSPENREPPYGAYFKSELRMQDLVDLNVYLYKTFKPMAYQCLSHPKNLAYYSLYFILIGWGAIQPHHSYSNCFDH